MSTFTESQNENAYPDEIEDHYWFVARHRFLVEQIARRISNTSYILDIGCGRGITASHLRRAGFQCWGTEQSRAAPISEEIAPFLIAAENLESLPQEITSRIEAVLILDVLEHLEEPLDLVRQCTILFPRIKYAFVTLPARQELWSNYDEFYGHKKRYCEKDVRSLFGHLQGACVADLRYFFKLLYLPAFFLTLFGRRRQVRLNGPTSGVARLIHRAVGRFCHLVDKSLPPLIRGTSVFALVEFHQTREQPE